jgi:DNA-directed RNA polymerase subunit L
MGGSMIQYKIKSPANQASYLEILTEDSGGINVLITREYENCLTQKEEFMSRDLFESCLRTGYLQLADKKEQKTDIINIMTVEDQKKEVGRKKSKISKAVEEIKEQ